MKDLKNIKTNGSASLSELQEFLGTLKGRNPQEVIGIVSTSLLIQSLVIATVGTILGMAIFTVLPYMIYGPLKSGPTAAKAVPSAAADDKGSEPAENKPADPTKPDLEKATKILGVEEAKTADPDKNPLESNPDLDKLLDR